MFILFLVYIARCLLFSVDRKKKKTKLKFNLITELACTCPRSTRLFPPRNDHQHIKPLSLIAIYAVRSVSRSAKRHLSEKSSSVFLFLSLCSSSIFRVFGR